MHTMPEMQLASIGLGARMSDFDLETSRGRTSLYDYQELGWLVLFVQPPTLNQATVSELKAASQLSQQLSKMDAKFLALTTDSVQKIAEYEKRILGDKNQLEFPIVSDRNHKITQTLGTLTNRAMIVLDPNHFVRLFTVYPAYLGHNFSELLRALQATQNFDQSRQVTNAVVPKSSETKSAETDQPQVKVGQAGKPAPVKPQLKLVSSNAQLS